MWINGVCYKTINFTLLEEELREEIKIQTGRTKFIPNYEIGEIVAITFKKDFLYLAKIIDLYPKQIKDFTLIEAKRDGFQSIEDFQNKLMEINDIKSKNHWAFITRFKKVKTILDY